MAYVLIHQNTQDTNLPRPCLILGKPCLSTLDSQHPGSDKRVAKSTVRPGISEGGENLTRRPGTGSNSSSSPTGTCYLQRRPCLRLARAVTSRKVFDKRVVWSSVECHEDRIQQHLKTPSIDYYKSRIMRTRLWSHNKHNLGANASNLLIFNQGNELLWITGF